MNSNPFLDPAQAAQTVQTVPTASPFQQPNVAAATPVQTTMQPQVQTIPVATPEQTVLTQPTAMPFTQPEPIQQPVEQSPVQIPTPVIPSAATESAFMPNLSVGQTILCRLSPGKFDALLQVLGMLDDKNPIIIKDSSICQSIINGSAILMADVTQLVDTKLNLHILNPKKSIKRLKAIKGNSDIFIVDDDSKYIVTNEDIELFLPKPMDTLQETQPPNLSDAVPVGEGQKIEKVWKAAVLANLDDSAVVNILIHQNQMKAVSIPDVANIPFPTYRKDGINDKNAELKLVSYSFLQVPGDDIVVALLFSRETYWLHTMVNTGLCQIHIIEVLNVAADDKQLF